MLKLGKRIVPILGSRRGPTCQTWTRSIRLLRRTHAGKIVLTKEFVGDDTPRYAILSHTWGAEEATFRDVMDGTGESKLGYDKILFCGDQASRDGLDYFWVDTCCIDKSSSAELQESINCMFRWYRDAARCYAYLADISAFAGRSDDQASEPDPPAWESTFRESRWFTRGWTLQELIAPPSVEFFSKHGEYLGNKTSLQQAICDATGVPAKALRGNVLSGFSVAERMAWMERRDTIREEDKAYSLLGIFGVQMSLIYGEGRENAFARLREEINKALKGVHYDDFSVTFSLSGLPEIEHFVAREEELAEIQQSLSSDGSRRAVILHGLGGIGKTQLAITYAKQYKHNYSAVFWINTKDKDSLSQSFAKVAKRILQEYPTAARLSCVDLKGDLDDVIEAVKGWLSLPNNTRWLMIYDNYDNPKLPGSTDSTTLDIREFLPDSYQGSVIITTRSSQVQVGHRINIGKLINIDDSLEILSKTSRREILPDDTDAVRLATELDGLPLALATAGAYLDQVGISFQDYLRLYRESWANLQTSSPQLSSYEDRTLYSTWQLSYDHIKEQNELAARLLCLWAYFDNQDIWPELLQNDHTDGPEWIRELTDNELSFNSAIGVLSEHGLIEVDMTLSEQTESRGYSLHACVHAWTIHVLNQSWDMDQARLAITSTASHIQSQDTTKWWLTQRRLLRHAARCSYMLLNNPEVADGMEWVFYNLGILYYDQGKMDLAEQMYQRALQGYEMTLGPDNPFAHSIIINLGILYYKRGNLDAAEQMLRQALQGCEAAFGPDHTTTLLAIHNLGLLYSDQGKLDLAEQMYQRTLQGYETALGPDHLNTLLAVHNLGIVYYNQGQLEVAEDMYQRALQGYEKQLGPDHTSTLLAVNNLGLIYSDQGKLDLAEQLYERALQGYENALGPDHIDTLDTINNLSGLYCNQGKLELAEQMYQQALQGYQKQLGPDHASTLLTVNNLGSVYLRQGKQDLAEQFYLEALHGYERTLSIEAIVRHRFALLTMYNLGYLYATQGKHSEALALYLRASAGYETLLGTSSREYRDTQELIASLDYTQGDKLRDDALEQKSQFTIGGFIRKLLS